MTVWQIKPTPKGVSNLFSQIDDDVMTSPHGWCSRLKAQTLAALVLGTRPETIVEIGVWSGKSLLPMALACREIGHGMVIGIDPYDPAASIEGQAPANVEWWSSVANHQAMHDYFLEQVTRLGLQNVTRLMRHRSDAVTPPSDIGLLSLDGNHGPQALRDAQRFAPNIRLGGFIVLDDLHWDGCAVSDAAEWLKLTGFVELFRVTTPPNDWGVFQKVGSVGHQQPSQPWPRT